MTDYELIELLLTLCYKRQDTKPIASELLKTFGGYAKVIEADTDELLKVRGVGPKVVAIFRMVKQINLHLLQVKESNRICLDGWKPVENYVKSITSNLKIKRISSNLPQYKIGGYR